LDQLSTQLNARLSQPLDIAEWLNFLAIDFVGDFAYGGMFNLVKEGKDSMGIQKFGVDGLRAIETLGTIAWIRPIVLALPNPGVRKWSEMSLGVVEKRRREKSQHRDLSYYLVSTRTYISRSSYSSSRTTDERRRRRTASGYDERDTCARDHARPLRGRRYNRHLHGRRALLPHDTPYMLPTAAC
jgi:hypothetical protein